MYIHGTTADIQKELYFIPAALHFSLISSPFRVYGKYNICF